MTLAPSAEYLAHRAEKRARRERCKYLAGRAVFGLGVAIAAIPCLALAPLFALVLLCRKDPP